MVINAILPFFNCLLYNNFYNMCGIAGRAYFGKKTSVASREIIKMTDAIAHRGPDDSGVYISPNKNVGLGNRRLAILDLSANGHQPMVYMNRYVIVSNNEVYNYREEREKLIRKGYKFFSNCDTEVIVALYAEYGRRCLLHMRGMYAIAIYDIHENTLFLARDRIGKKPLKYVLNDEGIIFASELKAILKSKGIKSKPDMEAIGLYLNYGYCPAPYTGFKNIKKLKPGHFMFMNLNRRTVEIKKYWEPVFKEKLDLSEKEWCQKITETLEESTKLRMIADVPVGAFLSGGVDSSAVVTMMAQMSTKPIKTFTISFKDKDLDESKYAGRIAKMYKTDHHVLQAKPQSVEILPFLAKHLEEPFADASSIVTYMISDLTKKYVTVALNGDGGDENFAGYPNRYFRLKRDIDYFSLIKNTTPTALTALKSINKFKKTKIIGRAINFFSKAHTPLYEKFASYNRIFTPGEIYAFAKGSLKEEVGKFDSGAIVKECFDLFKGKDLKDFGLKFDLLYFLPDQLLTKMDMASMATSLETRSPLLDQKMIELACKIPFNLKIKNGETKYILKKALEPIIPKTNLYRPKMGFTIPLDRWFKGSLNNYALSELTGKNTLITEFIDREYIKTIIKSNNKDFDFGPRIWSLLSLELWMKSYFG
jgi:asparagine synthase (glutamine-hydrolysing)